MGRYLCEYKLNKFLHLINLLKGEMSFVGPSSRYTRICRST
ncbi:MAG: sugar transferase [Flavobacteriales bacterium]